MSEASSRRLQTGGVTLQQAFDIHQQGTQKEGTLHPWWHTKTHMQARIRTHIHAKPAPTDHSPAVQTGLITSYPPLPTTTTRVLTTQWVDAQPRGASIQQSEKQQHQWAHIIIHLTAPRA